MMMTRRGFLKTCAWSIFTMGLSLGKTSFAAEYNIPVFMYHRVGYTEGALTVTPERLSGDLSRLLGNGYVPITMQQFENYIFQQKGTLPAKPVLLTFDDGYCDNYQNAFPILQKYGVAATFFVITGMLNDPIRLSPEQIREMAKYRMAFGSHTVSHQALARLTPERVAYELNASKLMLEDVLGSEVTSLAYPGGSYNKNVLETAGDCGYTSGFTIRPAICTRWRPPLELPRIPIFCYTGDVIDSISRAYS